MTSQQEVDAAIAAINSSCRSSGGVYKGYSCKVVSWDDCQRGTVGGGLSCVGPNITDTRLWEKNGTRLYTVRGDNWNEKLGKVRADQVHVFVGDVEAGTQRTITLKDFLENVE